MNIVRIVTVLHCLGNDDKEESVPVQHRCIHRRPHCRVHVSNRVTPLPPVFLTVVD